MKCLILFSRKNKKNITDKSSAESSHTRSVISVKFSNTDNLSWYRLLFCLCTFVLYFLIAVE